MSADHDVKPGPICVPTRDLAVSQAGMNAGSFPGCPPVDILHAGVVVVTHAQRLREDQAGRKPQARRARDATAGLTVTRLANADGKVTFAALCS